MRLLAGPYSQLVTNRPHRNLGVTCRWCSVLSPEGIERRGEKRRPNRRGGAFV